MCEQMFAIHVVVLMLKCPILLSSISYMINVLVDHVMEILIITNSKEVSQIRL